MAAHNGSVQCEQTAVAVKQEPDVAGMTDIITSGEPAGAQREQANAEHALMGNATQGGALVYQDTGSKGHMPAFNIGKHRGHIVLDVAAKDPAYVDFMLEKPDLPQDMKDVMTSAQRRVAENPGAAPGLLKIETSAKPGDWATYDGTLVWEPVLNVGRYKGQTLKSIAATDPSYLRWMLTAGFPRDVERLVMDALLQE